MRGAPCRRGETLDFTVSYASYGRSCMSRVTWRCGLPILSLMRSVFLESPALAQRVGPLESGVSESPPAIRNAKSGILPPWSASSRHGGGSRCAPDAVGQFRPSHITLPCRYNGMTGAEGPEVRRRVSGTSNLFEDRKTLAESPWKAVPAWTMSGFISLHILPRTLGHDLVP